MADETGRAVGTKLEDPKDVLNGRLHLRGKAEFLNSEVEKGGRKVEGASPGYPNMMQGSKSFTNQNSTNLQLLRIRRSRKAGRLKLNPISLEETHTNPNKALLTAPQKSADIAGP